MSYGVKFSQKKVQRERKKENVQIEVISVPFGLRNWLKSS